MLAYRFPSLAFDATMFSPRMDINDFKKHEPPGARRSRMEPFHGDIVSLKAEGYTDAQIAKWLATNGLDVSREAVRQFIKRHGGKPSPPRSGAPSAPDNVLSHGQAVQGTPMETDSEALQETLEETSPALTKKQQRERMSAQFMELAEKANLARLTNTKESK